MVTAVWDVADHSFRCACPGSFIGFSHDQSFCLTEDPKQGVRAWDIIVHTKEQAPQVALEKLNPADFPFHQRVQLFQSGNSVKIQDVFDTTRPPREIQISFGRINAPTLRTANERYILLSTWHESPISEARGLACHDLESGEKVFGTGETEFDSHLNRLLFSPEHNLLTLIKQAKPSFFNPHSSLWLGTFERQDPVRAVRFNPKDRSRLAIASGNSIEFLRVPDLLEGHGSPDHSRSLKWETEKQVVEANEILDIAFHPESEQLASILGDEIHIWNMRTEIVESTFNRQLRKKI
jgi:hypothetical protein